jgi:hypothetical protein
VGVVSWLSGSKTLSFAIKSEGPKGLNVNLGGHRNKVGHGKGNRKLVPGTLHLWASYLAEVGGLG